ncbi:hypothetical protein [Noviherbaspirillum aerium]|uniref:hypothetical protein n=1 Tax=Noviherbaspirillum aerium TaxID=2588497 RepID=UPI00124E7D41|nr:hypothetical protein [Noviherbaspirillum aerium]
MTRISTFSTTSMQAQPTQHAPAQNGGKPPAAVAPAIPARNNGLPAAKAARDRRRMERLVDQPVRKITDDSGYATGGEEPFTPAKSPSEEGSSHRYTLPEPNRVSSIASSHYSKTGFDDLGSIPDSPLPGRAGGELDKASIESNEPAHDWTSVTRSFHKTPRMSDLDSITDWGSTRENSTPALELIKDAHDADNSVNHLQTRAKIVKSRMRRALVDALHGGDAEAISYLRRQMYYIGDRNYCAEIIIAAARECPGVESRASARAVQQFMRLLTYRTTAAERQQATQAIRKKYTADRIASRLDLALQQNDAAEIEDLRMLMSELSISLDQEQLKAAVERLPEAVGQGRGSAVRACAPLLRQAPGGGWYHSAIISAADQCISAPAESRADAIAGITLLAGGLDNASLERVLTSLARSLPHQQDAGRPSAVRAFGDAIARHAGQLDKAARARLLAEFETAVKPRKADPEFSEACRDVRTRLKGQPGKLPRIVNRAFNGTGSPADTAPTREEPQYLTMLVPAEPSGLFTLPMI